MKSPGFSNVVIVSCGTLGLERKRLGAEGFLDYSDWMGIPIIPDPDSLDRSKMLLADA